MRSLLAVAAFAPLAFAPVTAKPARCDLSVTRTIPFTKAGARDVLEVRASGIECAKTVVTISIRRANGTPVAAFATPFAWLHDEIDLSKPLKRATLDRHLQTYVADAQLDIGASQLPSWTSDDQTPGFSQGHELTSPLPREQYETLRQAKPNMLCLRDAHETFVCYAWDKKGDRAEAIIRR